MACLDFRWWGPRRVQEQFVFRHVPSKKLIFSAFPIQKSLMFSKWPSKRSLFKGSSDPHEKNIKKQKSINLIFCIRNTFFTQGFRITETKCTHSHISFQYDSIFEHIYRFWERSSFFNLSKTFSAHRSLISFFDPNKIILAHIHENYTNSRSFKHPSNDSLYIRTHPRGVREIISVNWIASRSLLFVTMKWLNQICSKNLGEILSKIEKKILFTSVFFRLLRQ